MQFGSIGWSVGATLGYAQALKGKKRVIASIGDGSFQVTAQVRLAFFFLSSSLAFIIFHTLSCNFMLLILFLLSSFLEHPCHLLSPLHSAAFYFNIIISERGQMMKFVVLHGVYTDTQTGSSHTYKCQDKSITMPRSNRICVNHHDTSIHTYKHHRCKCKCVSEHDDMT